MTGEVRNKITKLSSNKKVIGIGETGLDYYYENSNRENQIKTQSQMNKGLWWIPRHPETMKGVVTDETLRGAGNKLRSEDSRIGQPQVLLVEFIDQREVT